VPGQPTAAAASQRKTSEVMQEQLALLLVRYGEAHPDIIRLRADIEKVKRIEEERQASSTGDASKGTQVAPEDPAKGLSAATGAVTRQALGREPAEFAHTREQVAGLRAQILGSDKEILDRKAEQLQILHDLDQDQRRMEKLPVREQEMAQITRDYEMSKLNYKSLLDKKMAAEMSLDMERRQQSERFLVVDRAQLPEKPIKPKRPALYADAAALALVLGLTVGFVAELRRNVFLGEWELPEGTPVLARLPYIEISAVSDQKKPVSPNRWFSRKKPLANAMTSLYLAGAASAWLNFWLKRQ